MTGEEGRFHAINTGRSSTEAVRKATHLITSTVSDGKGAVILVGEGTFTWNCSKIQQFVFTIGQYTRAGYSARGNWSRFMLMLMKDREHGTLTIPSTEITTWRMKKGMGLSVSLRSLSRNTGRT